MESAEVELNQDDDLMLEVISAIDGV